MTIGQGWVYLPSHEMPVNLPTVPSKANLTEDGMVYLKSFYEQTLQTLPLQLFNCVYLGVLNARSWLHIQYRLKLNTLFPSFVGAFRETYGEEYTYFWLCAVYKGLFYELESAYPIAALSKYHEFVKRNCIVSKRSIGLQSTSNKRFKDTCQ